MPAHYYLLHIRRVLACRFQLNFEIGKRLHERTGVLARRGGDIVRSAEAPDEPREQALGDAYRLEREVRYRMSDMIPCVARFLAREGGEVHMREDELCVRDLLVEALAFAREHASAALCFILRER